MTGTVFDCAIIGAGPAGITITRKLGRAGLKLALVEGGGREPSIESQSIYEGTASGLPYGLDHSRLRYFGGTSGHWAGLCRPLDREDYASRSDIGRVSWPFDGAALRPYWPEVCDILDLPKRPQWRPRPEDIDPEDAKAQKSAGVREVYWAWSPPTRFGDKYWSEISASPNISLFLNTTAMSFTPDPTDRSAIRSVECRDTETGETRSISARFFVLSCGGIENARTLLFSNALNGTGYGNTSGLLGVGFMEHPHVKVGSFVGFKPFVNSPGNRQPHRYFKTTPTLQKEHGVLNSVIRLVYSGKFDHEDFTQWKFSLPEPVTGGDVYVVSEQEPTTRNAITLTEARDRLGVPMVNLDLRLSERDHATVAASAQAIAAYLVYSQLGRARIDLTVPFQVGEQLHFGNHHMGVTRMGKDDRTGVVTPNGLVFGTQNLFVAGSSLFPTSGHANPTFTIVSLALRLADHLKRYKA